MYKVTKVCTVAFVIQATLLQVLEYHVAWLEEIGFSHHQVHLEAVSDECCIFDTHYMISVNLIYLLCE